MQPLIFEYGLGDKISEKPSSKLDININSKDAPLVVPKYVLLSPDGAVVAVVTATRLLMFTYSGRRIAEVLLSDTVSELLSTHSLGTTQKPLSLAWSTDALSAILLTKDGDVFVYDRCCNEVMTVPAHGWLPKTALSECVKIVPFAPSIHSSDKHTAHTIEDGVVHIHTHVVMESGDVATVEIKANKSEGGTGSNTEYRDQSITLLDFALIVDFCNAHSSDLGFANNIPRIWSVNNALWLPKSQLLLLVCHRRLTKEAGVLATWAPFLKAQGPKSGHTGSEGNKLSIFTMKYDELGIAKRKFNAKASCWSLIRTEPGCVDVMTAAPLQDTNTSGGPLSATHSAVSSGVGLGSGVGVGVGMLQSFWKGGAVHTTPVHGVVQMISDPAEE
jgi:hypothetical protein